MVTPSHFNAGFVMSFWTTSCFMAKEAKVLAENWRLEYNDHRPHSSQGYKTPAQFAAACIASVSATPRPEQYTTQNVENSLKTCGT